MPAVSDKQRKFFGLVRGIQKGTAHGSMKAQKVAETISPQDASDFASKVVKRKKRENISKAIMSGPSGY